MQTHIARPYVGSLAALLIVLAAAAVLAFALVAGHGSAATVKGPAATQAAPTVVHAAPAADANPDSSLPICMRKGGPTC
jgi:hypothetical protein